MKKLMMMVLVSVITSTVYAQKSEIGFLAGGSFYWGDIVSEPEPSTIKESLGVHFRYFHNKNLSTKIFIGYCRVGGADSLPLSSSYQKNRNLSFFSDIVEASVQCEYNIVLNKFKHRRKQKKDYMYIFGGIGVFAFNPKTYDPGSQSEIELAPQKNNGRSYSLSAICFPVGVGYKHYFSRNFYAGAEIGIRYTTTSYIDDVGQGHKKTKGRMNDRLMMDVSINDFYSMFGITAGYKLQERIKIRCPKF